MGDAKSLAHTKWNCKYHIVFAPKYRRQVFYGEKKRAIGEILRKLCEWKGVKIIEAECCPDHIHMLVEIPPKMSVSSFVGYLKGKSSLMIYDQFGDLKFKYRNREFWCRGYYVDTVGKNKAKIAEYVANYDPEKPETALAGEAYETIRKQHPTWLNAMDCFTIEFHQADVGELQTALDAIAAIGADA